MTRVIGVLECFEQLCKSLRSPAVFLWTTSFTRDAYLPKRFASQQNFFIKKLVLPAVPEILLVLIASPHRYKINTSGISISQPLPLFPIAKVTHSVAPER